MLQDPGPEYNHLGPHVNSSSVHIHDDQVSLGIARLFNIDTRMLALEGTSYITEGGVCKAQPREMTFSRSHTS